MSLNVCGINSKGKQISTCLIKLIKFVISFLYTYSVFVCHLFSTFIVFNITLQQHFIIFTMLYWIQCFSMLFVSSF